MKIKQTMKRLGIVSLSTLIIPLMVGPTASVYAQEEGATESSAKETQESIQKIKDPLSILSKLDESSSSVKLSDDITEVSEEDEDEKSDTSQEEVSTTEETEEAKDEEESKKTRAITPFASVTFGNWVVTDEGSGYSLEQFTGADTHVVIPGELNGKYVYITKRFLQSLINTNITDLAVAGPITLPMGASLYERDYTNALANNTKLVNVDFSNTTGSAQERSMFGMFAGCTSLKSVKMTGSSGSSHGTFYGNTSAMFSGCINLESVDMGTSYTHLPSVVPGGLGNRNTSFMFQGCSKLKNLNLSNMRVDLVTNMRAMFAGCSSLEGLDLSTFRTDYVTDMSNMFESCSNITSINTANWITGNVTTMHKMFVNCQSLPQLYLSHFDTTQVQDMSGMFAGCQSLTSGTFSFTTNTQKVISTADMFNGCSSLTSLDLTHMNTYQVQNMSGMFNGCTALVNLNVESVNFNTIHVQNMNAMFANTGLSSLRIPQFNTSNVQDMSYMFLGSNNLKVLDLTSFNLSSVLNMTNMFKTGAQTELFVLTNDSKLLAHTYGSDNRVPPEILFQANYGQFSDTSTSKNYFTRCALTPAEATVSQVQNFMSNNTPTRTNRTFEGWSLVSGNDVNAVSAFTQLFGTTYKAKWNSFGLAQVPTAKSFSGNLSKGTVTLPTSGSTNEVGVLDESADTKGWLLTAQLVWSGTAPNSTTTLKTTSSGTSDEISPTGTTVTAPSGLISTGGNLSISTTPGTVMIGNAGVQPFEGTYVTDLGSISLELADGSAVVAQTYSGNIQWDLAIVP